MSLVKNILKEILRITGLFIPLILAVATVTFFIFYILPLYNGAESIGETTGETLGKVVGKAIGTYKGITKGIEQGEKDGEDEATNPTDTVTEIQNAMENVGNLQVLDAQVKVDGYRETGDNYAILYVNDCHAVYTVDLNKLDVKKNDDIISVVIPKLDMTLYKGQPQLLGEYKSGIFNGKASVGQTAYDKSEIKTEEEIKSKITNYSDLENQAEKAAITQIEDIVNLVNVEGLTVSVEFKDENNTTDITLLEEVN